MTFRLILAVAAVLVAAAPLPAAPRGDEPVAVPRTIKQGIDFTYVDPQMSTVARRHQRPRNWLARALSLDFGGRKTGPNRLFVDLAEGLKRYQARWSRLPQARLSAGVALKPGASGKAVEALRVRLGLKRGGGYDDALSQAVTDYQRVHGLAPADGIAGKATIASLNRGAAYYERRIAINMERAFRLPTMGTFRKYVVVDSGAAEVILFDHDKPADSMRVVVGSAKTKTPMMAVLMRNAKANPYWNVPPDLIRSLTARRVREQGVSYLDQYHYELLSDWTDNARPVDPKTVNWKRVAAGKSDLRVRQLPGPWNSMGAMKFEMPNDFGIYLHDTPHKELFAQDDRWLSNGCVRLSDYRRFADWVFGRVPRAATAREQNFDLPRPMPIYLTYLTVSADKDGILFRPDPYALDRLAMPQMFAQGGRSGS